MLEGRDVSGPRCGRVTPFADGDVCADTPAVNVLQSKQQASDNNDRKCFDFILQDTRKTALRFAHEL